MTISKILDWTLYTIIVFSYGYAMLSLASLWR